VFRVLPIMWRFLGVLTVCTVFTAMAQPPDEPVEKPRKKSSKKKNKKDEEPVTQVLPLPKDLPAAISAETDRLTFFVTPYPPKGS